MYSLDMQDLIFEFYALVSLARITLDELVKYVRPLFARSSTLPKSINDFLKGQTDCPLASMLILGGEDLVHYLVDIRNCIVHYRTFATSDNTLAVLEGADETQLSSMPYFDALRCVTRVYFRYLGGDKVSVNVLLPDKIFDDSGSSKKLVQPFSYSLRYNLLSQSREFVRLCTAGVAGALYLRGANDGPTFSWAKR